MIFSKQDYFFFLVHSGRTRSVCVFDFVTAFNQIGDACFCAANDLILSRKKKKKQAPLN